MVKLHINKNSINYVQNKNIKAEKNTFGETTIVSKLK